MKGRKSGAIFCHLCHIMQQERGVQGKTLCNHQPQFYAVGRSENLGGNGRGRGWRGQIAIQGLSREKELLLFLPKFWEEFPPCPSPPVPPALTIRGRRPRCQNGFKIRQKKDALHPTFFPLLFSFFLFFFWRQ